MIINIRTPNRFFATFVTASLLVFFSIETRSDENLLGYVKGAEPLPKNAWELYQISTYRNGKGQGRYQAWDLKTEVEFGVSDRLAIIGALKAQSVSTNGLIVNGYLPEEKTFSLNASGMEIGAKFNFLSPALDDLGLAAYYSLDFDWKDPHSGQAKKTLSMELNFLFQKYFLEGEIIWVANIGTESTHATRSAIANLPVDIEWPTFPEMEIELKTGTGVSYRFIENWYIGAELLYESEFETEIGQERWSIFSGPSLHFGSQKWWATLTWLPQLRGGGETYDGQKTGLHLIEKTQNETRLKIGFNF